MDPFLTGGVGVPGDNTGGVFPSTVILTVRRVSHLQLETVMPRACFFYGSSYLL